MSCDLGLRYELSGYLVHIFLVTRNAVNTLIDESKLFQGCFEFTDVPMVSTYEYE